jgi:hypothetical protein
MTDQRLYRWSGPNLELIEIVVPTAGETSPGSRLRSLEGLEDLVASLLQNETNDTGESRLMSA